MYYPDLGTSAQIASGPHVRAVGWLDAEHAFTTGRLDDQVIERIRAFARAWGASIEALGWPAAAGGHQCELCEAVWAGGNFGVPQGDILFVCPEMIAHYVADHAYAPPAEFVAAITSSELPGSDAYAKAVAPFRTSPRRR